MNYRQATEALLVLMRVHMEECPDDTTIARGYRLIWKQQCEYGNEYSYFKTVPIGDEDAAAGQICQDLVEIDDGGAWG